MGDRAPQTVDSFPWDARLLRPSSFGSLAAFVIVLPKQRTNQQQDKGGIQCEPQTLILIPMLLYAKAAILNFRVARHQ
jgi:hypothetical protein